MLPHLWQRSDLCKKVQEFKNHKMVTYYLQNEPLLMFFACQGAEQCRRVMLQTEKNILLVSAVNRLSMPKKSFTGVLACKTHEVIRR